MSCTFQIEDDILTGYRGVIDFGSIYIPDEVVEIRRNAFLDCKKIKAVTIPGSVKEIGTRAFANCAHLESVTVLDGVDLICPEAFKGCTGLRSVHLPSSVRWICQNTFEGCPEDCAITVPAGFMGLDLADYSAIKRDAQPQRNDAPPPPDNNASYTLTPQELEQMLASEFLGRTPDKREEEVWKHYDLLSKSDREKVLGAELVVQYHDRYSETEVEIKLNGVEYSYSYYIDPTVDEYYEDPEPCVGLYGANIVYCSPKNIAIYRKGDVVCLDVESEPPTYMSYLDYCSCARVPAHP